MSAHISFLHWIEATYIIEVAASCCNQILVSSLRRNLLLVLEEARQEPPEVRPLPIRPSFRPLPIRLGQRIRGWGLQGWPWPPGSGPRLCGRLINSHGLLDFHRLWQRVEERPPALSRTLFLPGPRLFSVSPTPSGHQCSRNVGEKNGGGSWKEWKVLDV